VLYLEDGGYIVMINVGNYKPDEGGVTPRKA
jgi:hypothetical protein